MAEGEMEEETGKTVCGVSIKKVVVIGPESTGKSTLSRALAEALHTLWVPEYARAYLEGMQRAYQEDDLLEIAKGQLASEDRQAGCANNLLVCDTDLHVLKVWSEHRYHRCNRWILEQIAERRYDLYLLTYIDVAWQYDPLREHAADNMRRYFYEQYKDIVVHSNVPWVDVRGGAQERLHSCIDAINAHC